MRILLTLLFFTWKLVCFAQEVNVYGQATIKGKPAPGVLVCVFENGNFFVKNYSDEKGKFGFNLLSQRNYLAIFYAPKAKLTSFSVKNKLDDNVQSIPIEVDLEPIVEEKDTAIFESSLIKSIKPSIAKEFIKQVFLATKERDSLTSNELIREAKSEEERFQNFKQTKTVAKGKTIIETKIGLDTYELIHKKHGIKEYYKNAKPITVATYEFETTRRFEGVYKSEKFENTNKK